MEIDKKDLAKVIEIMTAKNLSITDVFDILEEAPKIIDEKDEIELAVDYQNTLRTILSNNHFTHRVIGFDEKNCPTPRELIGKRVKVLSKLFYFDHSNKEVAEKKMDEAGFRQANIRELISLSGMNIEPRNKLIDGLTEDIPIELKCVSIRILALGYTKNDYFPIVNYSRFGVRYLQQTNHIENTLGFGNMYVLGIKK